MRFVAVTGILILMMMACASKITTGGAKGDKYTEDLSVLRNDIVAPADTTVKHVSPTDTEVKRNPPAYTEPRHTVNASLDAILDSINEKNINRGVVDGFTIQLYSGTKREEALDVKKQVSTALPNLDAEVQFVQPNFRVRAGKYISRVDAQKDFVAVKKFFPNAIIIPDRIPIR